VHHAATNLILIRFAIFAFGLLLTSSYFSVKHKETFMKPLLLFFPGIALCISSCMIMSAPAYFGSRYTATNDVQVFYSLKDVKQPYEVIGHMNAPTGNAQSSNDETRDLVIQKAKEVGADAVIFSEVNRQTNHKTTDDLSVKVEVIKYLKN
jgi:hypothetical protein